MAFSFNSRGHICGCYYNTIVDNRPRRTYLPQMKLDANTTILSTASRTVLRQTFYNGTNANGEDKLDEIRYAFPLFDGVSVVDFKCQVGDRTIFGIVKEKIEARKVYKEARERGEKAALLEQLPEASDVFTASVSNIPASSSVEVTVTYVQELKHDAEVDGVRFTMPTRIAPRYGTYPGEMHTSSNLHSSSGISITIDVNMADGIPIKKIISPSHPIELSLGTLSTSKTDEETSVSKASATLALGTAELEKDFVLQIVAKDVGVPQAILETHLTIPNQRALMTTLVPKFNLKSRKPEIVLVADRSGSMQGNIATLISALQVFLKSIPISCMFNICSFGSDYTFLWSESRAYDQHTLAEALEHVQSFKADFGGTETLKAVKGVIENRCEQLSTEVMLLTDGDIWSQGDLFKYVEQQTSGGRVRLFPIGIGSGVSSSLIEGVARAGRGFAQMVGNDEKLDGKVVRMLKGALTPHVHDYRLELKYEDNSLEAVADGLSLQLEMDNEERMDGEKEDQSSKVPISLYDPNIQEEHPKTEEAEHTFAELPPIERPTILQSPSEIPALFPFNRTSVYLLLSPKAANARPKSVILKATSPDGPLELEIPIEIRAKPDEMVHQLAARRAVQELEEDRGWLNHVKSRDGVPLKTALPAKFFYMVHREAVRLGVEFQVGGRYCSFVAVEASEDEITEKRKKAIKALTKHTLTQESIDGDEDWEILGDSRASQFLSTSAEVKEEEEMSDGDDMGFGLFDYDDVATVSRIPTEVQEVPMRAHFAPMSFSRSGVQPAKKLQDFFGEVPQPAVVQQSSKPEAVPPKEEPPKEPLVKYLIKQQSFEGSWDLDHVPREHMGLEKDNELGFDQLAEAHPTVDRELLSQILATAIIVLFLERRLSDEEDVWDLVVEKAREWTEAAEQGETAASAWVLAEKLIPKD